MSFRLRLIYYLVHHHNLTNRKAKQLISESRVFINNKPVNENVVLNDDHSVMIDGDLIRPPLVREVLCFYKPKGYESTLSLKVKNNLSRFFGDNKGLIIAGRLDKDSEGLLLLSNDGKWVESICNPASEKEKEYLVTLDRVPDQHFSKKFSSGVLLGDYLTKTCQCEATQGRTVRVILKEGKNRQIRRMCHKLGYGVESLVRIRIDRFVIGSLQPGQWHKSQQE